MSASMVAEALHVSGQANGFHCQSDSLLVLSETTDQVVATRHLTTSLII